MTSRFSRPVFSSLGERGGNLNKEHDVITEEQKQQLDALFKFKIGDVLQMAHTPYRARSSRLHVVERLLQQCPGGVQLHYRCRAFVGDGNCGRELTQLVETELQLSEPFGDDPLDMWIAANKKPEAE